MVRPPPPSAGAERFPARGHSHHFGRSLGKSARSLPSYQTSLGSGRNTAGDGALASAQRASQQINYSRTVPAWHAIVYQKLEVHHRGLRSEIGIPLPAPFTAFTARKEARIGPLPHMHQISVSFSHSALGHSGCLPAIGVRHTRWASRPESGTVDPHCSGPSADTDLSSPRNLFSKQPFCHQLGEDKTIQNYETPKQIRCLAEASLPVHRRVATHLLLCQSTCSSDRAPSYLPLLVKTKNSMHGSSCFTEERSPNPQAKLDSEAPVLFPLRLCEVSRPRCCSAFSAQSVRSSAHSSSEARGSSCWLAWKAR